MPETPTPATEPATPAAPVPAPPAAAAPTTPATWDELFKGEDPAKVREALENSRKWESRAKENKRALDEAAPKLTEYDALVQASKSDLEKAQETAQAAQARELAAITRAAKAEVRVQAGEKFLDPDVPFAFLDPAKFVGKDGDIDEAAVTTALDDLLKAKPHLAKPANGRAPAPNPAQGSSASGAPDLEAQIAQAQASGDVALQIRLQNQKLLAPLKQ